jgi:hypothetical protein
MPTAQDEIATAADARASYLVRPAQAITDETVTVLVRDGVDPVIARVDLEAPKLLLLAEPEWTAARASVAELEYKRFLSLHLWNRCLPHPLVPTVLVDGLWHAHILDTYAYVADTVRLFGTYLHHFPYLGFGSEANAKQKRRAFEQTCALYEWTFGESYMRSVVTLRELSA